jgi:hypothetical protein
MPLVAVLIEGELNPFDFDKKRTRTKGKAVGRTKSITTIFI